MTAVLPSRLRLVRSPRVRRVRPDIDPMAGHWSGRLLLWALLSGTVYVIGGTVAESTIGKALLIVGVLLASVSLRLDRLLVMVLFITLAFEEPGSRPYSGLWTNPIQEAANFWFDTIGKSVGVPLPVSPAILVVTIMATRTVLGARGDRFARHADTVVVPSVFVRSTALAIVVVVIAAAWGVRNGGSVQQVYYQAYGLMILLGCTITAAKVGRYELINVICRTLLYIAMYRAGVAIYLYFTVLKGYEGELPQYLTTHNDSVLWCVALAFLAARFVERPSRATRLAAVAGSLWLLFAIVVNNRRLGWVVLAASVLYVVVSSSSAARRRMRPVLAILIPILIVYTAAGLAAPPARAFAPVQSLKSVVTGDDRSSQTRDIEDYNLAATMRDNLPFPKGLGQPYTEYVVADDISRFFAQYQYLPHNSVLGMLMIFGPVGFALVLMPALLGIRGAHLVRKRSPDAQQRVLMAAVVSAWIGYVLQGWGDLAMFNAVPSVVAGILAGCGVASAAQYTAGSGQDRT